MKETTRVPPFPPRAADGHKGSFGTLDLLAGSDGMLGAAILAARGALRGGVGLCRVCLPAEAMAVFTVAVPAATTFARTPMLRGFFGRATAAVLGPGLGTGAATGRQVRVALRRANVPLLLDADALNLLSPLRGPLRSALGEDSGIVLTPHPGEAARLLHTDNRTIQRDRLEAACALARISAQTVVLKGAATIVCDGSRYYVNRTGNDGLATGGSGDVLSGLIGALLARGMQPFDAACLGAHVHGKAGDLVARRLSPSGLTAEDLPLAIAEVMR